MGAWHEAIRCVMEQTCLLLERRVAAGSGWGLLIEEDRLSARWFCSTCKARERLLKQKVYRKDLPMLFRAFDEDKTVLLHDIPYHQVGAAGPGRQGGGLTTSDVLLLPIRVEGRVVGTIGLDLYKHRGVIKPGGDQPKSLFTEVNVHAAEEMAATTGGCVANVVSQTLKGNKVDWTMAYLETVLKQMRQRLVESKEEGVEEVRAALRVPCKQTIVIIDALFKVIDYRHPEWESLSWTSKRDIFLNTNMWERMIRFHPVRWRGNIDGFLKVAKGLVSLGPDEIVHRCSKAFQSAFAWLDTVVVMVTRRHHISMLHNKLFRGVPETPDTQSDFAAIDSWRLPDQGESDDELVYLDPPSSPSSKRETPDLSSVATPPSEFGGNKKRNKSPRSSARWGGNVAPGTADSDDKLMRAAQKVQMKRKLPTQFVGYGDATEQQGLVTCNPHGVY